MGAGGGMSREPDWFFEQLDIMWEKMVRVGYGFGEGRRASCKSFKSLGIKIFASHIERKVTWKIDVT